MSKYTITIHNLINSGFDFGLNDYPIFDEKYREELNTQLLEYYRFREIGFETEGLFKNRLNAVMNRIMPKYNYYFRVETKDYNPLYNIELHETFSHTVENNESGNRSNSTNGKSEDNTQKTETINTTPDRPIDLDTLNNNGYADSIGRNKTTGNTTNENTENEQHTNSGTQTETYTKTTEGSSAGLPFSKAIMQYRKCAISVIDTIVHDEQISNLFMKVY